MAIKIIGTDDQHVKQVSCRKCASRLEYTLSDTTTYTSYDYGGGSDTYRSLRCPKCGYDINVGHA